MKTKSFTERVFDALAENGAFKRTQPRVLRSFRRLQVLESVLYCDYDLRGLSKSEKDFIRGNEYRCYYDCGGKRFYIFIARNLTTGKKQLYAYEKKQYFTPNAQDANGVFNYEKWLLVNTRWEKISVFNYERRFSNNSLAPVWIYW
jgi:hypothetical protein